MIIKIGDYYLNQSVKDIAGLKELNPEEYTSLHLHGKMLPGERDYYAKDVYFNGNSWKIIIGALNGKVYKISPQILDKDKDNIDKIFKSTLDYFIREIGKWNEQPYCKNYPSEMYIWDAPEGNVILEKSNNFAWNFINIFLTSKSITNDRKSWIKTTFVFLLSMLSAYTLSFAVDLFLGGLLGIYPNTVFLPVTTWSVISFLSLILALTSTTPKEWLAIPFFIFGVIAILGALVGHSYSFGVACVLLLEGCLIWFLNK